jgi:Uma2 family endonuclease
LYHMQSLEIKPLLIDIHSITLRVTHEEFEKLCQDNPEQSFELTASGELVVMAPAGYESSEKNGDLFGELWIWNRQTKIGRAFDSSGGFTLPNGAIRSPDVTWIEKSKLLDVPAGVKFPQVIPDFVVELRSDTDSPEERLRQRMPKLREKMEEYRSNGVRLGLLINPKNQQVEIYRPGQETEILESPTAIDCSEVMPGFILSMSEIW